MRAAAGFTLLEAVVALTILGFVLLGAFTWVGNDLNALGKVRDLALEESAVQQAIAEEVITPTALKVISKRCITISIYGQMKENKTERTRAQAPAG